MVHKDASCDIIHCKNHCITKMSFPPQNSVNTVHNFRYGCNIVFQKNYNYVVVMYNKQNNKNKM